MRSLARAFTSTFARGSAVALVLTAAPAALADDADLEGADPQAADAPALIAHAPQANPQPAAAPGDAPAAGAARPMPHDRPRFRRRVIDGEEDTGPAFKDMLRLHAGPVSLEPIVLIQVQAIPYVGPDSTLEAADPAERGGFRLRRARFGFDGRVFHRVPFAVSAEFNSDARGAASLRDAWFGYDRFKFAQVFVGMHFVPFSRTALAGWGDQALIERPLAVRAMAPFYQLGAHVEGHLWNGGLNYYAGVYNGLQRTDQFFTGYVENSAILGNRFDGLTYAGRLTSEPLGNMGRTIQDLHHSKLKIGAGASFFYSDGGTRGILGVGGDLLLHYKGLHVLGEFIANRTTPKETPTQPTNQTATVTSMGLVGEVGYVILKERLGLTGRFEWLNPNTGVKDESDSWIVTAGVGYSVLKDFLRAQVDYTHREEMHGKSLKNDSVVIQAQLKL